MFRARIFLAICITLVSIVFGAAQDTYYASRAFEKLNMRYGRLANMQTIGKDVVVIFDATFKSYSIEYTDVYGDRKRLVLEYKPHILWDGMPRKNTNSLIENIQVCTLNGDEFLVLEKYYKDFSEPGSLMLTPLYIGGKEVDTENEPYSAFVVQPLVQVE